MNESKPDLDRVPLEVHLQPRSRHEVETYYLLRESSRANAMYHKSTQRVMELSVDICYE